MRICSILFFALLAPAAFAQNKAPSKADFVRGDDAAATPDMLKAMQAPPSDAHAVPALDQAAVLAPPSDNAVASTAGPKVIAPPPPVNLLSGTDSTLTTRETKNVATARRFIDGPSDQGRDLATEGAQSSVVFRFGGPMPSVVCAVGYICDLALQAGEVVNTVAVGDPVRWKITPATSGSAGAITTHVVIKPSDIGLSTNLLVTTDRRTYSLKLVSRKDDWMPTISFTYPEDEAAQWAAVVHHQQEERAATVLPDTGQSLSSLDFGYHVAGDSPAWRPLRVYSDGLKTYIQFPKAMIADEAPALVAIGADKQEQMVNYRLAGDRYVVDKVLDRAILVSGVGRHQVRVKIERREER